MIRPLKNTLTLILISAATLTACKKDKEDILTVNQENLAGTYTISSIMAKMGSEEKNVTNDMIPEACQRDDEFVLHDDNTFEYNDVGTKCEDDDSFVSEWYLDNNELVLDNEIFTIEKLSNKGLVLKKTHTGNNMTVTVTYNFNRK